MSTTILIMLSGGQKLLIATTTYNQLYLTYQSTRCIEPIHVKASKKAMPTSLGLVYSYAGPVLKSFIKSDDEWPLLLTEISFGSSMDK